MRGGRLAGISAAGLLAMAAGMGAAVQPAPSGQEVRAAQASDSTAKGQPSKSVERQSLKHLFAGGYFGSPLTQRKRGPGWTQAQVQRMARKRRNVLKHKARSRRSKAK